MVKLICILTIFTISVLAYFAFLFICACITCAVFYKIFNCELGTVSKHPLARKVIYVCVIPSVLVSAVIFYVLATAVSW